METTILEELQGLFQAVFAANGQSVQGSCRGFHGICVDRYTVPCRDNHGIYRRTLASTGNGTEIADIRDMKNFVAGICGCKQEWTSESFVEATVRELREKLGDDKVVLGLSGGVDSLY